MKLFTALGVAASLAGACASKTCGGLNARTKPPPGAIVVDATGVYKNSVETMSEGVEQLDPDTTSVQTIFMLPGVYHEQVIVKQLSGPLVLQGYTCNAMSYASNQVTITQAKAQRDIPKEVKGEARNDMTSTIRFMTNKVKVYNLNVANTAGDVGQALAVNVRFEDYGFYACNFTSYQDTLLADRGHQLYARTYINGAIDFVFGRFALAWFEKCDIETVGPGYIAASGRNASSIKASFVFNRARVFGNSEKGSMFLGRPWREFASTVWQNSELSDVIAEKGWSTWNDTSSIANVDFGEYNNTGPGAKGKRVRWSKKLDEPVAITQILGDDYKKEWWVDTAYL
ncbi:unnamed protein product [Hyaloperonospora brassicae]|uniref:Pectinesterase n=1 Tax=Hyaloperonospora brassicae TaxID=162125 RepID=A0AAV0SYS2_HYABA|nr:unnamed protein product [Hyaloperonospora brassicae]